eukprot:gene6590-7282_t
MGLLSTLSRPILSCLLREWLEWRDISFLDVACVGNERIAWLALLADEILRPFFSPRHIPFHALTSYYAWLGHRGVAIEELAVNLSALEDVIPFAETLCSRSLTGLVFFDQPGDEISPVPLVEGLEVILSRCCALHELTFLGELPFDLLRVVDRHLHTLTKLHFVKTSYSPQKAALFVTRHTSTVRDLRLEGFSGDAVRILDFLQQNAFALQKLHLKIQGMSRVTHPVLLNYLSLHGGALQELVVERLPQRFVITDVTLDALLAVCPSLRDLTLLYGRAGISPNLLHLSRLFAKFDQMQSIHLDGLVIKTDSSQRHVSTSLALLQRSHAQSEDWIDCLRCVLKDGYTLSVNTNTLKVANEVIVLIVQRLKHFLTHLTACSPFMDSDLLSYLVRECSNLQSLTLSGLGSKVRDDALLAIAEHCPRLEALSLAGHSLNEDRAFFSDTAICHVAISCSRLEMLSLPGGGCCSLSAVARLPRLESFRFDDATGSEEELRSLFSSLSLCWPPSFRSGRIYLSCDTFFHIEQDVLPNQGIRVDFFDQEEC